MIDFHFEKDNILLTALDLSSMPGDGVSNLTLPEENDVFYYSNQLFTQVEIIKLLEGITDLLKQIQATNAQEVKAEDKEPEEPEETEEELQARLDALRERNKWKI